MHAHPHRRCSLRLLALVALAGLAVLPIVPAHARADERWMLSLDASAALPLSDPDSFAFGGGGGAGATGILSFDDVWSVAARVDGGLLSDAPPPGRHLQDPAVGDWATLTLALRLRPLGDLFHEGRRTTGPVLELGAGGAVTGDRVRPSLDGSLGWGIAAGDVVLVPQVGVTHIVAWDEPLGDVGAVVGRAGLGIVFFDTPPPEEVLEVPPGDRDHDGLLDQDDFCPDEPEDADDFQDDDGCPDLDDDRDGILDVDDACRLEPEDLDGDRDEDGCPEDPEPSDRDGDGFLDQDDACPDEPEVVNGIDDEDGCPDEGLIVLRGDRVVLDDRVLFDYDRARVRHGARPILEEVLALFRAHPQWDRVRIEGHTDVRGEDDYNQVLSERRARAVRAVLVSLGMHDDQIEVAAFGETRPYDLGEDEEAHARNRRVEIVMIDDTEIISLGPTPPAGADVEAAPASQVEPEAPPARAAEHPRRRASRRRTAIAAVDGGSR